MNSSLNPDLSNTGSTDINLVEAVKSRNQKAWQQFVEQYSPLIYVWCRKFDLQPADASDVSQQVFQAVDRSINRFEKNENQGSLRGWLFVITRNTVRNYISRTLNGPQAVGGTTIQQQLMELPDQIEEDSISSSDSLPQENLVDEIVSTIKPKFDERTWQCFWLVAIEGYSAVEVAKRLGMRSAAVRQAKYRVVQKLREEFKKYH